MKETCNKFCQNPWHVALLKQKEIERHCYIEWEKDKKFPVFHYQETPNGFFVLLLMKETYESYKTAVKYEKKPKEFVNTCQTTT